MGVVGMEAAVLLVLLVGALLTIFVQTLRIRRMKVEHRREKALAVRLSRAVSLGKAVEHLVPFLADFPFDPGDFRFLGAPVDFVVFAGLREKDDVEEIVFVEVKTGTGRLSRREQSVRRAVEEGRVSWREVSPPLPVS